MKIVALRIKLPQILPLACNPRLDKEDLRSRAKFEVRDLDGGYALILG